MALVGATGLEAGQLSWPKLGAIINVLVCWEEGARSWRASECKGQIEETSGIGLLRFTTSLRARCLSRHRPTQASLPDLIFHDLACLHAGSGFPSPVAFISWTVVADRGEARQDWSAACDIGSSCCGWWRI